MGFKRVRDPSINEIVLAAYVEDIKKGEYILNIFRIYSNIYYSLYLCPSLYQ
jgi:hypothetical protein